MSQGAEISQPSDSVTLHLLSETEGGRNEKMEGGEVRSEMKCKSH